MFRRSIALPLFLMVVLAPMACQSKSQDPVRAAEAFVEIARGAMEEQYVDLYSAVAHRVCAADKAVLEQKRDRFLQSLPPGLSAQLHFGNADLITRLQVPENLALDRGRLISLDGTEARVEFPTASPDKENGALAITMVLEDNQWRTCNLLSAGRIK